MIIYVPKVIESEQDARDLPVGTVIFDRTSYDEVVTGSKVGGNAWSTTDYTTEGWDYLDRQVVGWTSLRAVDVVDSLTSVVAERSEFHSVDEVRRRLKEK